MILCCFGGFAAGSLVVPLLWVWFCSWIWFGCGVGLGWLLAGGLCCAQGWLVVWGMVMIVVGIYGLRDWRLGVVIRFGFWVIL